MPPVKRTVKFWLMTASTVASAPSTVVSSALLMSVFVPGAICGVVMIELNWGASSSV